MLVEVVVVSVQRLVQTVSLTQASGRLWLLASCLFSIGCSLGARGVWLHGSGTPGALIVQAACMLCKHIQ
jgi:hypothetical protein